MGGSLVGAPNRRSALLGLPDTRGNGVRSGGGTSNGAGSLSNGRSATINAVAKATSALSPGTTSHSDEILSGRGDLMRWAVLGPLNPSIQQPTAFVSAGVAHPRGLRTDTILPPLPLTGAPSELADYYDSVRSLCAPAIVQRMQNDMLRIAAVLSNP
jgi:hypothetical protein